MAFLEEQLNQQFSFGSSVSQASSVDIVETRIGNEYRTQRHPFKRISIDLDFSMRSEAYMLDYIVDLWERSGGRLGGFRFRHPSDYSTNDYTGTPAYNDQACIATSTSGVYQATRWYGTQGGASTMRRLIKKVVSGTMLVGIRDEGSNDIQINTGVSPDRWTVGETTGLITFDANKTYPITGITNAANAVLTIGSHTLVAGDTVHISGVATMTQINGLRGTIQSVTATTITTDIDSSAFSSFSVSSPLAAVNTRPQTNETVLCGCEFDVPVRFETDLNALQYVTKNSESVYQSVAIRLVELLNP